MYRIRKVIRNIFINILGHEGKKSWDRDENVNIYTKRIEMWGRIGHTWQSKEACGSGCGYKEWENMGHLRNLIAVSGFFICNILYEIVEWFSLIHGCRHGWSNHVKISCIVCVDYFIFVFLINDVYIKTFAIVTN